ncbi:hypothetical protein FACS1894139_12330 [Planctomycetales bacterium]|nr:hypothetical protein FACS1894107_02200 [Planctomycetales bacterium]GHT06453.1 hypothetical protein FACS1894139_12330 [Planctomycetales bacterium]GHV19266.1 hypothetical protein AGMMS49959_03690 [Planctomycetales bacterium]
MSSNNAMLDAVNELLHHDNFDLQIAAVRVLGATQMLDDRAVKSMCDLLAHSANVELHAAIIDTFRAKPHPLALKYLVQSLARDSGNAARALTALVASGDDSIAALRSQFGSLPFSAQRQAVSIISLIRTAAAHQFFIDLCHTQDSELLREMIRLFRENFSRYRQPEIADLHGKLTDALKDPRAKAAATALSTFIIALGIAGSVNDYAALLPFLSNNYPLIVRRHALGSLANFNYSTTRHKELFDAVLDILGENEYDGLVRYAVAVLNNFNLRRQNNDQIRALLDNKHLGVRVYAVKNLATVDSVANAETVLKIWHTSRESPLRDAAVAALRAMPSSVAVILRHLEEFTGHAEAYELVQILSSHANRINDEKAKELFDRMYALYQKRHEESYQLYRSALAHLRGEVLLKEVCALAQKEQKSKNWAGVGDILRIIDHTELLTPELRFDLAIAQLKTSKLNRARTARDADPCLDNFKWFLRETEKGLTPKLLANKSLTPEELLYLGFHFAEQMNAERRFGLEMLKALREKYDKTEVGKTADKKLKSEGY